jgi:hypothetical protein
MGLHDPFGYLKHKLWPKEGSGVKLTIWLLTIKIQESLWFPYVQVANHILLENSQQGLQLCFRPHFNWRSAQDVMGLQNHMSPNLKNFGIPKLGVSRQNDIWVLALGTCIENTIKGESSGFPQIWAVMNLVSSCLLVAHPCTKSAPTTH